MKQKILVSIILLVLVFSPLSSIFSQEKCLYPIRQAYSHYIEGILLEKEGKITAAIEAYKKSLEYDPQSRFLRREIAKLYFRSGDLNSGLEILEKLVQENEKDSETNLILAQVYLVKGDRKKAISCYQNIISYEPENKEALLNLGNLLSETEPQRALELYERYLNLEPSEIRVIDVNLKLATIYLKLDEPEKALDVYQKIIQNYPDSEYAFLAYLNRAQIYEKKKDKEKAIQEYQSALSIEPNNSTLYLKLGAVCYEDKKYSQAKELFEKVITLDPKNLEAHYYLSFIAIEEKNWDQALAYLQKIVSVRKNDPKTYLQLSYLYSQKGQAKKALSALKKATKLDPNNYENFYFLGLAYQDLKKYSSAEKAYLRALELKPGYTEVLVQLAILSEHQKQVDKAVAYFRQLLTLEPKNALALNYVGYTYAEKGTNLEEAEKLITQALELDATNAAYIDSLGWVYYQKKDYENALRYLERASQMIEDPIIFDHLGDTYKKLGKLTEARDAWKKALKIDPKNKNLKRKLKEINYHFLPGTPIRKLLKRQEANQQQVTSLISLIDVKIDTEKGTLSLPTLFYYQSPKSIRIDLLGTFSVPQISIIIEEGINFFPATQTLFSPTEILSLGILLQDWLNGKLYASFDDTQMKVKKGWKYYYLYDETKEAYLEKKDGLFRHLDLKKENVNFEFEKYTLIEGLWLPQVIHIRFLEHKLSFSLELKNFILNQKLGEKTFLLPQVKE